MVYKKNYGMRRKTGKAGTPYKRLERKVNKIAKAIEPNYVDTIINSNIAYDVNNATTISALTQAGTGAPGTRKGARVTPYFLEFKGQIAQASSALQNPSTVRIMLIQARQRFVPNTTATTGTSNILDFQAASNTIFAPYDRDNRRHYTVLYDKTHQLGSWLTSTGVSTSIAQRKLIQMRLKLSRDIAYEESTTTTEGGQLYLCCWSDVANANTEPDIRGVFRIHYRDL